MKNKRLLKQIAIFSVIFILTVFDVWFWAQKKSTEEISVQNDPMIEKNSGDETQKENRQSEIDALEMIEADDPLVESILNGKNLNGDYWEYENEIYYFHYAWKQAPDWIVKLDLNPQRVVIKSKFYIKDDKKVYVAEEELGNADAATFEDLGNGYAKDNEHVFLVDKVLNNADGETFEVIPNDAWRNNPQVYHCAFNNSYDCNKRMEYSMGYYGKDATHVFFGEKIINGANAKLFEPLPFGYSKDGSSVFFRGEKIEEADSDSFRVLDRGVQITPASFERDALGRDDKSIFFGSKKMDNLDPNSFEIVDTYLVKDKNGIYRDKSSNGPNVFQKIEGVDLKTFTYLSYIYFKDKNNVYCYGEKMEGADAQSFIISEDWSAKDKKNTYHVCDISPEE